jgi:hypothetical protein
LALISIITAENDSLSNKGTLSHLIAMGDYSPGMGNGGPWDRQKADSGDSGEKGRDSARNADSGEHQALPGIVGVVLREGRRIIYIVAVALEKGILDLNQGTELLGGLNTAGRGRQFTRCRVDEGWQFCMQYCLAIRLLVHYQ